MGLAYIEKRIRMDIKLIEVDETIFKEEIGNKGIRIKPFLTIQELNEVYNDMMYSSDGKPKSSLDRYFAKVVHISKLTTNINFSGMSDEDIYNLVASLEMPYQFMLIMNEFEELDRIIAREESLYNMVKEINGNIGAMGIMDKLKEVLINGNKDTSGIK